MADKGKKNKEKMAKKAVKAKEKTIKKGRAQQAGKIDDQSNWNT